VYESYYYELLQETNAGDRFRAKYQMMNFDKRTDQLTTNCDSLEKTLETLKANVYVKQILGSVLALGNILNAKDTKL